jgi:multiple sugar transport system substrate-binding protein
MEQDRTRFQRRNIELSRLVRDVSQGRLSRRAFTRRALALGLSVPAITAALSALPRTHAWAQDATPSPELGGNLDLSALSPDIPEPTSPVTISYQTWQDTTTETFQGFLNQFHELHPNITVEPANVPAEQAGDVLTTQIAGGTAPDTVYMDAGAVTDFGSRSGLLNLDDYISKSIAIVPDDYVQAFRDSATIDNSFYGLPIDGETTGLFYRTDLFEAAGIEQPPTTWEEFRAAAEALTKPDSNQYGFAIFSTEAAFYWYSWLWQAGGKLVEDDGTTIAFNSDAGRKAAEFYVGLVDVAPPDYLASNSWDGRVAFAEGQVGMYIAGAWLAGTLQEEFPDATGKWSTAPLPVDVQCATQIAGDALAIPAGGKNNDAAWKWIEFLSAPQNMLLHNLGTPENPTTLLPPRASLLNDPRLFENNPLMQGFAEQMACGVSNNITNPNWGAIEEALNDALGRAMYGDITAADALQEAADEAEALGDQ